MPGKRKAGNGFRVARSATSGDNFLNVIRHPEREVSGKKS